MPEPSDERIDIRLVPPGAVVQVLGNCSGPGRHGADTSLYFEGQEIRGITGFELRCRASEFHCLRVDVMGKPDPIPEWIRTDLRIEFPDAKSV